ncbi:Hypothetical predicted protein [Mytilus galloprovincialis]|uniref:Nephrocystin 3-like N-terminal domain-containing protein n=1 Tax=Mytilus galloprovincialis TaxID=29158 RepID=A0A8B6GRU6_MYTGA|nr:Hypothetical predicted protein [Mytilus galloprovincialis]
MVSNNTNWSYVDSSKWPEDAREVQKCFNPDWCFKGESSSEDVSVLLSSMNNCHHFKQNVKDIRKIRNNVSHKSKIKVTEKVKYCQMLINFLKDSDIWVYEEARAATNDILIFKQTNFLQMIETEKCVRLINIVTEIIELNARIFELKETYYQLCHTILIVTLLVSVFSLQYAYKNKVDTTIYNLLEICNLEFGLDFDIYLQHHQTFVGRHWLFAGILQRMEDSRGVLLVADSGYGKSAAMANIIQGKHKLTHIDVIHHLCISNEATFQRGDTFILNIVQNLYCKYPLYGQILEKRGISLSLKNREIKQMCKFDPVYCFDELIAEPLSMFVPSKEQRLVLLIDSLDECNTIGFEYSVATLLRMRYRKLPEWIKLLITSTNDSGINENFSDLDHWHLYRDSDDNKRDLLLYSKKDFFSNDYLEYLGWNFALVKDILRKIKQDDASLIDKFPTSLEKMFEIEFSNIYDGCRSRLFKRARVLYEIVMASMKPLKKQELFEISTFFKEPMKHYTDFVIVFEEFVMTLDQYYYSKDIINLKPFLQEWMISHPKGHACKVNIMKGHAAISRFMLSNIAKHNVYVSHDYIVELFMHIQRSGKKKINMGLLNPLSNYVDKTICGRNFYGMPYEPCHSILDIFASVVDSFSLMRKMISFSKTQNRTLAAINALLMRNTNSFVAIVEGSSLDFTSFTNMNRLKTFVNFIYFGNDSGFVNEEDFTLLHLAIMKENYRAFKLIADKEKDTIKQKTTSGSTAIMLAVMHDQLGMFQFLTNNTTIGTVLLRFAAMGKSYKIFNFLLDSGIHDMCVTCKSFNHRLGYKTLYRDVTNSEWEFHASVFANRKFHTLITELTCESILNYATRIGDQVIVENILRVSNETLECRDFHGLTPLASAIVFQQPKLYTYLKERGASDEFRCKPVDVYKRTAQMIILDIYSEIYTKIPCIPLGTEYCSYGRSVGYLFLRWPSCEIMRSFQWKKIDMSFLFDIDNHFKTPLYYLVCESELTSWNGLYNPYSCKMFLLLLTLLQKPFDQNQIDILVENCNSPYIDISLISYSFTRLKFSNICKDPRLHFRNIDDIYFKVYIGDISNKTNPFFKQSVVTRPMRHIYTGKKLQDLFPIELQVFKEIEVYHKSTHGTSHLNPLFSIGIENKTISTISSSVQP